MHTGWLSARRLACGAATYEPFISGTMGLMDFAGSGVVHMVGGGAALVATLVTGPRLGRFDAPAQPAQRAEFAPSNPVYQVLGTFILWLGWWVWAAEVWSRCLLAP
jgi:Amt family ammonium transporter